ncbi:hypothetical protein' [Enterococcus faecium]|nr:hypothetical protein D357_01153 [Enterococcus faecium SD3B-2]CUX99258.1 hypothetical protein' [Enterococcus faecium]
MKKIERPNTRSSQSFYLFFMYFFQKKRTTKYFPNNRAVK